MKQTVNVDDVCWMQDLLYAYSSHYDSDVVLVPANKAEESRNLELVYDYEERMTYSGSAECYETGQDGRQRGENLWWTDEKEHLKTIGWKLKEKKKILKYLEEVKQDIVTKVDAMTSMLNELED